MNDSIDTQAKRNYLKVLRGLAKGDALGQPYGASRGVNRARRFVRSGEEHSDAVIQEMVRHGLLEIDARDEQELVSMTEAGHDFLEAQRS